MKPIFGSALLDIIPSYTTLLVMYDLKQLDVSQSQQRLQQLLDNLPEDTPNTPNKIHHLPVCYEIAYALDLADLARHNGLSESEVIQIHQQQRYHVCAIGFSPAFAYLAEVDQRIAHPRHASPRPQVAAGSLGIADIQTAIYPTSSPAGWQIIGRTPIELSIAEPSNLQRFQVGDQVQFHAITGDEFQRLSKLDFAQQQAVLQQLEEANA